MNNNYMNVLMFGKLSTAHKDQICKKCNSKINIGSSIYINAVLKDEKYSSESYHLDCIIDMIEEINLGLNKIKVLLSENKA